MHTCGPRNIFKYILAGSAPRDVSVSPVLCLGIPTLPTTVDNGDAEGPPCEELPFANTHQGEERGQGTEVILSFPCNGIMIFYCK